MSCGIYKIECLGNGKVYIGLSINIEKRWTRHKRELKSNQHKNEYIQRAWNKYGQETFTFEILEECKKDELSKREIELIEKYNSYHNGFNMTLGGEGGLSGYKRSKESIEKGRLKIIGRKSSIETRNKISKSRIGKYKGIENNFYGRHHSEETKEKIRNSQTPRCGKDNHNSIEVYQFDVNTLKILKKFESIRMAEKEICRKNGVQDCIEGEQKTCGGYYWQRVDDTINGKYIGKTKDKFLPYLRAVEQLDKNTGEVLNSFISTADASEFLGFKRSNNRICVALKDINRIAHGYKWRVKI